MDAVEVTLKSVSISQFSPAHQELQLSICFYDGKDKEIFKSIAVGDAEQIAPEIIREIRQLVRRANASFDGVSLRSYTAVIIADEDIVMQKLTTFIGQAFEKARVVKNYRKAEGYVDLVKDVNRLRIEFWRIRG